MRGLLTQITRDVARALADSQIRQVVFAEIQNSPYREHKLHLSDLLRGSGQPLLTGSAARRQVSQSRVLATMDSLVDLEFYLPVPEQFSQWHGGSNLIVASALHDDGTAPIGFDLQGERVALSAENPPSVPTLAIVPVETDFSTPPPRVSGVTSAQTSVSGVYMTWQNIYDDHEGWLMGGPEFEVHVFKQNDAGQYVDVGCSGEYQAAPYYYNNDGYWSGEVLLATEATVGTGRVQYQVWEDDTGACTATGGRPPKTTSATYGALSAWTSAVNAISKATGPAVIALAIAAIPVAYNLIQSINYDDEVGVMSEPVGGCWEATGPVRFEIRSSAAGHPLAGEAFLDYRFGQRTPICALSATVDGPTDIYLVFGQPNTPAEWFANVHGGQGSISYAWYDNGVFKGSASTYTMDPVTLGGHFLQLNVTRGTEAVHPLLNVTVSEAQCPQPPCP